MLEEGQNQRIRFAEIMEKKGEDDRISALSDCLILEILSRLPSTKDAIRTGALSKGWQHLWTLVPTLIFSPSDHLPTLYLQNPKERSGFALLVDKTLSQCRQLKIKKFEVRTLYDIRFKSQFRNWIRFAVSCKVEELNLRFCREKGEFVVGQFLFINSCLTDLTLAECKLNPTGPISWENLRSLCISRVHLDEYLLANIFSGSPLLETLNLEYCKWPYIFFESESDMIKISDPTSLSLTQCRQLKHLKKSKLCVNDDIESHPQINNSIHYAIRCKVKELNLEFGNMYSGCEFMIDQILFTSSSLAELRLERCIVNPDGAISWKSLRFLCISWVHLDEDLIENILCGSPVLETLELNDCYGYGRLDITSKSVQNVVLRGYEDTYAESEDDAIEINAPNILSLTIECETILCKLLLLNVSSLVKAYLDYTCTKLEQCQKTPTEKEQEMLKGLIMNLGHVKELELGSLCAKALSCLEDQGFVSPSNVKVVE